MVTQLVDGLRRIFRRMLEAFRAFVAVAAPIARRLWAVLRVPLMAVLNVLAALILLFEEWGWRPLSSLLGQLTRFRPWALMELWIAGLPPYGALVALGVPSVILIPAKFVGVYFLALGHVVSAAVVLGLAKIASTAFISRIFILTKPALMQIGWFSQAYNAFVPWQEALFDWIRSSWIWRYGRVLKWRAKNFARRAWGRLRPRLIAAWAMLRPRAAAVLLRARLEVRNAGRRAIVEGKRLFQRLRDRGA